MHFSCILLFLCKLFHGIVTMLYSNFHNIVSTISIYLLGNASKKKKKKIDFSLGLDCQGYSDSGERNYGAIDEL